MNDRPHPTILIDDRERAGGLAAEVRRVTACPVEVRRLAVGDVMIGERLVSERKEAADLVASLVDGRLERQLHELARFKGQAIVIIEGEFNPHALAGMAPQAVRQAMLSIQLDRRIALIRSRDLADTARWIAALAERTTGGPQPFEPVFKAPERPAAPHPTGHRARRPEMPLNPEIVQLKALLRIPGIGSSKARALLAQFGSVQGILSASDGDLAALPGIGPALAQALRQAFGRS